MSRIRVYLAACLWGFAVFALGACSEAPSEPLRVGINPWPGYGALFLAADKGFFADEGIDVELVELSSLSDVRRAFERGQIDGMASSLVEVLEAARNGARKPVIAMMADYSNGADVVLARDGVSDIASLKGQRIGLEAGTLNHFILARALAKDGLSLGDVQIVNMPQLAMADAVATQRVDAVVSYPPISTEIMRGGLVSKIFSSKEIPGEVADVVSFEREVVVRRSAEIDGFVRAWGHAVAFIEEHPQEACEIIGRYIGMSASEMAEVFQDIEVISADRQAEFLRPSGPLADGVKTMTSILWPDEAAGSDLAAAAFFRGFAEAAWTGAE
jgi:NitT/TauT family transport system substrate-binding protein